MKSFVMNRFQLIAFIIIWILLTLLPCNADEPEVTKHRNTATLTNIASETSGARTKKTGEDNKKNIKKVSKTSKPHKQTIPATPLNLRIVYSHKTN